MPKRRQPDNPHDGPGSHDAKGVKRGKAKRVERQYTDEDRTAFCLRYARTGSLAQGCAALTPPAPHATAQEWLKQPRWASLVGETRQAYARETEHRRDAEASAYLELGNEARDLARQCIKQGKDIAAGVDVPKEQRIPPAYAIGVLREAVNAFVTLDRAAKTVSLAETSDGGITVQVVRGSGVTRKPTAVNED